MILFGKVFMNGKFVFKCNLYSILFGDSFTLMGKEMSSFLIVSFLHNAISIMNLSIKDNNIWGVVGISLRIWKYFKSSKSYCHSKNGQWKWVLFSQRLWILNRYVWWPIKQCSIDSFYVATKVLVYMTTLVATQNNKI